MSFGPYAASGYVDGLAVLSRLRKRHAIDDLLLDEAHPTALANREVARSIAHKIEPWLRSFNYPGVRSPAIDALIEAMLVARDRAPFEAAVRAFDRVLLSGDYVVPLFHDPKEWIAASASLAFPERLPLLGVTLDAWWFKR